MKISLARITIALVAAAVVSACSDDNSSTSDGPRAVDQSIDRPTRDQSADRPPMVDQTGIDQAGIDQAGIDQAGFDQAGFDQAGFDQAGIDHSLIGDDASVVDATMGDATMGDATMGDATMADANAADQGIPPLVSQVDEARYLADLKVIAQKRPPGSSHWQAIQDLCATRFQQHGFQVTRHRYASGVNVIGVLPGTKKPAERVLISAHYDHVRNCNGADDNASGVAGVLEAARVLSKSSYDRSLVVACWDEEERGLIGSKAWVSEAKSKGQTIIVSYVFEMIGFTSDQKDSQKLPTGFDLLFPAAVGQIRANQNRGDFIATIHDQQASGHAAKAVAAMKQTARDVGLSLIDLGVPDFLLPILPDLLRSDHAPFWSNGYPAIMITDTANFRNPNYHCTAGPDDVSTLDTTFASQVVQATVGSALRMLSSS